MLADILKNRLFIGALAIFIFCVGGSLLYMRHVTQKGEKELAETQTHVEQWNERQKEQPTAEAPVVEPPEQGGHFHEDGTFHAEPHALVTESSPTETETPIDGASPTRTGPLTYHADLLASHPVEALRAQAEERGHWSSQWIPPFPSDDHEAAALARTFYLIVYYRSTGEIDTSKAQPVLIENGRLMDTLVMADDSIRGHDLIKLSWAILQAGDIEDPYDASSNFPLPGMTYLAPLGIYHRIDISLLK